MSGQYFQDLRVDALSDNFLHKDFVAAQAATKSLSSEMDMPKDEP